jgi:prepilin-type N-terminal cleavage/methylation domain-containing protein
MKKGFTIVELAIVLVVIGIILAMAVKGRNLVEAARYKAEINKIRKLEAAVHIWLATNPEFHIDNEGEWQQVAMQFFYDKGILTENDMKSLAIEGTGAGDSIGSRHGEAGYWRLMRCQYLDRGIANRASIEGLNGRGGNFNGTNFCAQITVGVDQNPGQGYDNIFWFVNMPLRLQCMTELLLDDMDKTSGAARYDARWATPPAEFTDDEYKNCMDLPMTEPSDSNMFYVLY